MSSAFRDSIIVVLDTGRTTVRAGYGIHDLLRTPAVEVQARVGLRKNATSNGDAVLNGLPADARAGPSSVKTAATKVHDYLVGSQLDEALAAGQDVEIFWPFERGDIADWTQAEAVWKYVLFYALRLRRSLMESPILLSIPAITRDTAERACQLFFERFNVAGFALLERPTAQFCATLSKNDQTNGVVVDIDLHHTDITPISDGFPQSGARVNVPLGMHDCLCYLASLLRANPAIVTVLSPPEAPLPDEALQAALVELARKLWEDGLIKALAEGEAARDLEEEGVTDIAAVLVAGKEKAVIESGMKKKATAKASAAEQARAREIEALDLVQVTFHENTFTIGKERHRFCEPLFDPSLLAGVQGIEEKKPQRGLPVLPVHTATGEAVARTEVDMRQYIWGGLLVTGEITNHIKGLGTALQGRLASYLLVGPDPGPQNEVQAKAIRVLKVPEYFAEYREKGDGLASFLGSSIVAKIVFADSQGSSFVSKADYTSKGPRTVLGMSPSLL